MSNIKTGEGFCLEPCYSCKRAIDGKWTRVYPPEGTSGSPVVFCENCSFQAVSLYHKFSTSNRAERRAYRKEEKRKNR